MRVSNLPLVNTSNFRIVTTCNQDWAMCLDRMCEHKARGEVPMDGMTDAIYRSSIRKYLRHVKHVGASAEPYLAQLAAEAKKPPTKLLQLYLALLWELGLAVALPRA